jgi:hypothetical protein
VPANGNTRRYWRVSTTTASGAALLASFSAASRSSLPLRHARESPPDERELIAAPVLTALLARGMDAMIGGVPASLADRLRLTCRRS